METIKSINIAVRFLLELCLVAAVAFVGYKLPSQTWLRWLAAGGFVIVTASVWGYFIAPKAEHLLLQPYRLLVELVLFGLAILGLGLIGQPKLALLFAVITAVNEVLLIIWKQ